MCGIYGEIALVPGRQVGVYGDAATDALRHRGPDGRGTWKGDSVFLGSRRLSIIDLPGGAQPMWDADEELCIVYNGELYNFLELRAELEGHGQRFRTRSDTEVVLAAYRRWGPRCLDRFNGMFAFAIWDTRDRSLFLARDPVGEKPLYFFHDGHRFAFASEVKALLVDPTIPREIDPQGLANYLAFGHSMPPATMFRGISKLPPAHYVVVRGDRVDVRSYWDVGFASSDLPPVPDSIESLLDDSVRARLIADVPVGAFLSGGVDSTAVVALMRRHVERVQTFSLGFAEGGAFDELPHARAAARHLGTEHHELNATDVDLAATLQTLVYHYDEPFGDPAGFPVYLLSRFASDHVKVVLSGDGGDELFGGYRRYAADRVASLYQRLPSVLSARAVPGVVGAIPRARRIKQSLRALPVKDPGRRYAAWLGVFSPEMRAELVAGHMRDVATEPEDRYAALYGAAGGSVVDDHVNRLLYLDLKIILPDAYLEKVDKATMACSLEARLPMLDPRLIELAFRLPGRAKVSGWTLKKALKEAVKGLVPEEVLGRRKHGFSVPTDPWFRGPLSSFAFEVLLDERTRRRGYFDDNMVHRLWKEHGEGRNVWDRHLWLLLNFELWHRSYIDSDDRPAAVAER